MDRKKIKEQALYLRKQNKTYSEICKSLKVKIPKSTLSYWCKDVPLPASYFKKLNLLNYRILGEARALAVLANRKKQEQLLDRIKKENKHLVKNLNKDVCKLLLSVIYYAEGSKHRSTRSLRLGNADPNDLVLLCY